MSGRIEIVAEPGFGPVAVLAWPCHWLAASNAARLLGDHVFAAKLSKRWGRMVYCTPEFLMFWMSRRGRPAALFSLEVLQ